LFNPACTSSECPCAEESGRQVVRWRALAFAYRRNVTLGPRVKHPADATDERKIAAKRDVLESGCFAQCVVQLLTETRARGHLRITRLWKGKETDPEILGVESGILLAQPNETSNKQGRTRE
jgi:hypothetical protein